MTKKKHDHEQQQIGQGHRMLEAHVFRHRVGLFGPTSKHTRKTRTAVGGRFKRAPLDYANHKRGATATHLVGPLWYP